MCTAGATLRADECATATVAVGVADTLRTNVGKEDLSQDRKAER